MTFRVLELTMIEEEIYTHNAGLREIANHHKCLYFLEHVRRVYICSTAGLVLLYKPILKSQMPAEYQDVVLILNIPKGLIEPKGRATDIKLTPSYFEHSETESQTSKLFRLSQR